jgi:flavin reductase (DIM6/NTAB) family NADH-FMN oxidoreductase RutF
VNFACTLAKEVTIEESSQIVVFAKVERIWVTDAAVAQDDQDRIVIDPEVIDPLLRLGAGNYGKLGGVIPAPQIS